MKKKDNMKGGLSEPVAVHQVVGNAANYTSGKAPDISKLYQASTLKQTSKKWGK